MQPAIRSKSRMKLNESKATKKCRLKNEEWMAISICVRPTGYVTIVDSNPLLPQFRFDFDLI
jgi:hypothetical protein